MQLTSHICRLCGSHRDSPSPLKICLGCAGVVERVRRDAKGVCRCLDCEERVCGVAFDVVQKATAKIAGGQQAVALVNQVLQECGSGG